MRIEPDLLADHLRAAAIEQTFQRLSRQGYEVEREARLGDDVLADLKAIPPSGKERLYHFVLAGMKAAGRPERASLVRAAAAARGADYHLVLVRPPREVEVEVVGIEAALRQALIDDPPEDLRKLAPEWESMRITDVGIDRARLVRGESYVTGEGLITVTFPVEDEEDPIEMGVYPLRFDIVFDAQGALRPVKPLEVDTSS